jgi:ribonuclease HII
LAFGVPKDTLEELKQYTEEQRLIEVLKYWLRNHCGRPTWQEVEKVQERVNTNMQTNTKQGKSIERG